MASEAGCPGVSGMAVYVPPFRVNLEQWCEWTGNTWGKVQSVVGRSFRVPGPDENAYTMAASAVLELIERYDVNPTDIGFLGLGTESSTDNSAGAVIVRGMVDRALERLGKPRLARRLEVPEFKHACLGGMYALKGALRYLATDGRGRRAIVVSSDIAEYARGSSGEQTQGAGAVALLVDEKPTLFEVDLAYAGGTSDYRGPDFRKPFARHFHAAYRNGSDRPGDYPVFSGKYSTFAYLDETIHAFEHMLERLGESTLDFFDRSSALFFHRPYHMMPVQALAFLYVRGLAEDETRRSELSALCSEAGVGVGEILDEMSSRPDLYGAILAGNLEAHPYPATSAASGVARKSAAFRALQDAKMNLGSDPVKDLGNLYTAALPAWIAAGLDAAAARDLDLAGKRMAMIGYGSGDAAEAIPFRIVPGWKEAASKIHFAESLEPAVDLSRAEYEALHDGAPIDIAPPSSRGFSISRRGDRYEPGFQDLCVEYYEYLS